MMFIRLFFLWLLELKNVRAVDETCLLQERHRDFGCPVQQACIADATCYAQDGKDISFGQQAQPCFWGAPGTCNNCYEYSANNPTLVQSSPGEALGVDIGGLTWPLTFTCEKLRKGLEADGAAFLDGYGPDRAPEVPAKGHNIFLLVTTNESAVVDFHFVRQDSDGTWSQKHGDNDPTQYDSASPPKKLGKNPWNADWTVPFGQPLADVADASQNRNVWGVSGALKIYNALGTQSIQAQSEETIIYAPCGYYHVSGSLKISGLPQNDTQKFINNAICSCTFEPERSSDCSGFHVGTVECRGVYHDPGTYPALVPRPCDS